MNTYDFSGIWRSVYHYKVTPSYEVRHSEHDVKIHQDGEQLVIESLPNPEGSYLVMRLKLGGNVATGVWEEVTSPTGHYKGEIYPGAVQLVLSDDGKKFYGMFLGIDRRTEVQSNYWEITRK